MLHSILCYMPSFPESLLLESIASSYSTARKVVRALLQSGHWSQRKCLLSLTSAPYTLFVSHGSGDSDMINGGGSGMINDDLITDVEEKSSSVNEP